MKTIQKVDVVERWHEVGIALNEMQAAAMEIAHTNKPFGPHYKAAWRELGEHLPHLMKVDSATRAHASWLATNWEAVDCWRKTLAINQRVEWNHPTTIRRRYDAAFRPPIEKPAGTLSPMAQKNATIVQLQERVDELDKRLKGSRPKAALRSTELDDELEDWASRVRDIVWNAMRTTDGRWPELFARIHGEIDELEDNQQKYHGSMFAETATEQKGKPARPRKAREKKPAARMSNP
jgi:hypothetical protein